MGDAEKLYFEKTFEKKPRHGMTLAVDFDGVLNSYKTKAGLDKQHLLPDPPVEGAVEWIQEMVQHFNVVVFTCRAFFPAGKEAIIGWLEKHGFPPVDVTHEKPIATWYLDDRGIRFEGAFPSLELLQTLEKPWNRK